MLNIIVPSDGTGVEVGAIRVMGTTTGASVQVNGETAEIAPDGSFQHDLLLNEGPNQIEVVASDQFDRSVSKSLTAFHVPSTAGLPFTLLYPKDGMETVKPTVEVIGVTRPDVVVGVNEVPATINALGIFSTEVPLQEGDNLIEVVAVDLEDNVRFQTSVVFYLP